MRDPLQMFGLGRDAISHVTVLHEHLAHVLIVIRRVTVGLGG